MQRTPITLKVQEYLTYKKYTPLGPYRKPGPLIVWWSEGGAAVSYEGGTPVTARGGRVLDQVLAEMQGLLKIKDTHRPRTLRWFYAWSKGRS